MESRDEKDRYIANPLRLLRATTEMIRTERSGNFEHPLDERRAYSTGVYAVSYLVERPAASEEELAT